MAIVLLTIAVLAVLGADKLIHQQKQDARRLAHRASQKVFATEYAQALEMYQKAKNHSCNRKSGFQLEPDNLTLFVGGVLPPPTS